ncbi:SRPBCC family protein [Alloactinosynnema sp. L-07]|uniref:SRPBCC family protein n=1 Tax=Alloactinosynnema sp. L-07 TaxID=1653480 RepID=UPI0008333058|nr:SRPBCC family protein [Alloactinosynnema sp. L-07]
MEPTISRSKTIAVGADVVWGLVSDLPNMGRFSPENVGGHWVDGTGPAVGARFRGTNRNGEREWHTNATVVECVPERLLTFDVRSPFGVRVSRWSYVLEPTATGCVLTENWYRVGSWFIRRFLGPKVTGRTDRPGFNTHSIDYTLAAVKAFAENSGQVVGTLSTGQPESTVDES